MGKILMTNTMTIYQPSYDTTLKTTGKEQTTDKRTIKSKQIMSNIKHFKSKHVHLQKQSPLILNSRNVYHELKLSANQCQKY